MRILLVRHAHAGARGTWPDDLQRELSDRGRAQADAIGERWADSSVAVVLSSRAVRCTETVRPLADRLELDVTEHPQLLEGAAPSGALAWLESLDLETTHDTHDTIVACSHGDVIGGMVRRLAGRGTSLDGDLRWPKGSTWELEVQDGVVVGGRLHAVPEVEVV